MAVTVLVLVSITDTVSGVKFVTYTSVPARLTATPTGPPPTVTVAVTVFVPVSITDTLADPKLVM